MPTFNKVADSDNVEGRLRSVIYDVVLDNSYPAGGEAVTAANVGLRRILGARHLGGNAASAMYLWSWDTANSKIICGYPTGSTIAAPAAVGDPIVAAGAVAVTGVNADGRFTAGRGKELANTTDASTLTVRFQFFGD